MKWVVPPVATQPTETNHAEKDFGCLGILLDPGCRSRTRAVAAPCPSGSGRRRGANTWRGPGEAGGLSGDVHWRRVGGRHRFAWAAGVGRRLLPALVDQGWPAERTAGDHRRP